MGFGIEPDMVWLHLLKTTLLLMVPEAHALPTGLGQETEGQGKGNLGGRKEDCEDLWEGKWAQREGLGPVLRGAHGRSREEGTVGSRAGEATCSRRDGIEDQRGRLGG